MSDKELTLEELENNEALDLEYINSENEYSSLTTNDKINMCKKPSWEDAPVWANYLTMDADGEWVWFEYDPAPSLLNENWVILEDHHKYKSSEIYGNPLLVDWQIMKFTKLDNYTKEKLGL